MKSKKKLDCSNVQHSTQQFDADTSRLCSGSAEQREMIYTFLTEELQLNAAVASGILANLYQESGFEPLPLASTPITKSAMVFVSGMVLVMQIYKRFAVKMVMRMIRWTDSLPIWKTIC